MRDNYSNFDPFQFINMQAGVSNQVWRVPEIYERKPTGIVLENLFFVVFISIRFSRKFT